MRPADSQMAVGIQREILPRLSAEVDLQPAMVHQFHGDGQRPGRTLRLQPVQHRGAIDPRLPKAVVLRSTTCGTSTRRSLAVDNFVAPSDDYGHRISYWHGVDVNISGRMRNGLMFQGGTSTGRAVTDTCDVRQSSIRPAAGTAGWSHHS